MRLVQVPWLLQGCIPVPHHQRRIVQASCRKNFRLRKGKASHCRGIPQLTNGLSLRNFSLVQVWSASIHISNARILVNVAWFPRLARLLLNWAADDVVRDLTHKEIAQQLRVYRESATSALGELRKAGIVSVERKRIRILDRLRRERASRE